MPVAVVASVGKSAYGTSDNIALSGGDRMTVAAGDLVIITLHYQISNTVTVADDGGNNYTVMDEEGSANAEYGRIAYCFIANSKTNSTITATFGSSQSERKTINALRCTKDASETWNFDGGNFGLNSFGVAVATGNFSTSYADAVSVAIGFTNTSSTWTLTNIGDSAGTAFPATNPSDMQISFYRLHGAITDCHADVERSAGAWLGAIFYSFGVSGGAQFQPAWAGGSNHLIQPGVQL